MATKKHDRVAEALVDQFGPEARLNRRAFFALRGHSVDWRRDLVELLRSSEPIHLGVRETLADAIEGETVEGTSLELKGAGANRDRTVALASRDRWIEMGDWMEAQIAAGAKRKDAILNASVQFNSSMEKCEAALTYTRKCHKWTAEFLGSTKELSPYFNEGAARWLYHQKSADAEREKKNRKRRGNASS